VRRILPTVQRLRAASSFSSSPHHASRAATSAKPAAPAPAEVRARGSVPRASIRGIRATPGPRRGADSTVSLRGLPLRRELSGRAMRLRGLRAVRAGPHRAPLATRAACAASSSARACTRICERCRAFMRAKSSSSS
jgi:hypothetical protein